MIGSLQYQHLTNCDSLEEYEGKESNMFGGYPEEDEGAIIEGFDTVMKLIDQLNRRVDQLEHIVAQLKQEAK